uniref:Dodecin domain-containing protein n=1 Tax=Panagrellus redivivus TaxID=6233 RepID=A0A7E4WA00_PANRE
MPDDIHADVLATVQSVATSLAGSVAQISVLSSNYLQKKNFKEGHLGHYAEAYITFKLFPSSKPYKNPNFE